MDRDLLRSLDPTASDADIDEIMASDSSSRIVDDILNGTTTLATAATQLREDRKMATQFDDGPKAMEETFSATDLQAMQHVFCPFRTEPEVLAALQAHGGDLVAAARTLLAGPVPISVAGPTMSPPRMQHAAPQFFSPMHSSAAQRLAAFGVDVTKVESDPNRMVAHARSVYGARFTDEQLRNFVSQIGPSTAADAFAMLDQLPPDSPMLQPPPPPPPTVRDCAICMDQHPIEDMCFFMNCPHAFCFEGLMHHIQSRVETGALPTCPSEECDNRQLPQLEAEMVFKGDTSNPLMQRVARLYLSVSLAATGMVRCPRPGCESGVIPRTPGRVEKCICECRYAFCSLCQGCFHYDVPCLEARRVAAAWDAWLREGRVQYMRERAALDTEWRARLQEFESRRVKHTTEVQAAMQRRAELSQDEQWKAQHCRACPHCGRAIQKLEGCDSMRCGQDAHGGNVQNGCGQAFSWSQARPYTAQTEGGPAVKAFEEAAPAAAVKDIMLVDDVALPCDLCSDRGVVSGLGFRCINCPGAFTVCCKCEGKLTTGAHDANHVFRQIKPREA